MMPPRSAPRGKPSGGPSLFRANPTIPTGRAAGAAYTLKAHKTLTLTTTGGSLNISYHTFHREALVLEVGADAANAKDDYDTIVDRCVQGMGFIPFADFITGDF